MMKQMKHLSVSMSLSIGLVTVAVLRLALKPLRLLDQALSRVGKWLIVRWKN